VAFDEFRKWGIKGIKVDFMDRDDQWMVNYYHRIAAKAAENKLIVDFHGAYKPEGIRRMYPNVLTREGVNGAEQFKWSMRQTPEHDLILPFGRMLAGPLDYTPGAMTNAQEKDFKPIFDTPMSMGTRCHQLAMYVIYESPLQMLCDSPTKYYREPACMQFLADVPTVWDQTVVLDAKVSDYLLMARRNGDNWFVGGMTDWDAREMTLDLSFLPKGQKYKMTIYRDGINADRDGNDFKREEIIVDSSYRQPLKMAPGGGFAAMLHPVKQQ
jgi:alpha-glucosidase